MEIRINPSKLWNARRILVYSYWCTEYVRDLSESSALLESILRKVGACDARTGHAPQWTGGWRQSPRSRDWGYKATLYHHQECLWGYYWGWSSSCWGFLLWARLVLPVQGSCVPAEEGSLGFLNAIILRGGQEVGVHGRFSSWECHLPYFQYSLEFWRVLQSLERQNCYL